MQKNYALTIKYNSNFLTNSDLEDVYKYYIYHLKKTFQLKFVAGVFELDSKQKLHLHAHVTAPAKYKYSDFKIPGFMTFIKPVTNQTGWYKYMYKSPLQILTSRSMVGTKDRFQLFCGQYELLHRDTVDAAKLAFDSVLTQFLQKNGTGPDKDSGDDAIVKTNIIPQSAPPDAGGEGG